MFYLIQKLTIWNEGLIFPFKNSTEILIEVLLYLQINEGELITLVFITLVPTVRKMFIKLFSFVFLFINNYAYFGGSLVAQMVKSLPAVQETHVQSLGWEDPLGRQPTPVFLPGEFHGWRSLTGYSPWGCKELDTAE